MSAIRGYPAQQKLERTPIQFVTVEPVRKEQNGFSVLAHQFVYEVGTDVAEIGSTVGKIVASGHACLEGDVILLTSGVHSGKELKVISVDADEINLAEDLSSAIAAGVTFKILRHKYPSVDADGVLNVNAVIAEQALAPDGGALPADLKVVAGYDGAAVKVLKTDAAGELQIDVLSSALPSGAATEATLATLGTEATLAAIKTAVETIDDAISGSEMQVDVVSSVLPSGAATEATLATLATEATVSTLATEATVSTLATEATVSTLATEATVSTLATEATVSTLATEATVSTLATEATVSTLGTETTLAAVKTAVEIIDNAISGNEMQVDVKKIEGLIDTANGSTTPLGVGASFVGAWTQITDYASIHVGIYSDQDSAAAGVEIEFSEDGVGVHHIHTFTYFAASNGVGYLFQPEFKYFRVRYVNGGVAQTTFKLISTLRSVMIPQSLYPANYTFTGQSQVTLTKGIIVGETTAGGGAYVPVKVNPSGALTVEADITSSVLPTGAATEAKQDSAISILTTIDADTGALAGCVSGNEIQVDVVSAALPTGAATEATLASVEADTSSLAGCVAGNEVQVDVVSSALPFGAATDATLGTVATYTLNIANAVVSNRMQTDIVSALPSGTNNIGDVDVASIVASTGRSAVTRARHVYSSTPVTTGTYQQLVLSLGATVNEIEIFDSSGETLVLATGGSGSEVDQVYVFPGGNGRIPLRITSGTRVSVKAVSATASAGEIAINFYS